MNIAQDWLADILIAGGLLLAFYGFRGALRAWRRYRAEKREARAFAEGMRSSLYGKTLLGLIAERGAGVDFNDDTIRVKLDTRWHPDDPSFAPHPLERPGLCCEPADD